MDAAALATPLAIYRGTRGGAYALLGGIFGALGGSAAGLFGTSLSRALPFLGIVFGLDRHLPRPPFVSRLPTATWQWIRRGLALVSALIVGGRAVATNPSLLAPVKCLLCR